MKRLGSRQVEKSAKAVVGFINEKSDITLPEPTLLGDTWSSEVEVADTPVGAVFFNMHMSGLGLFLHVRIREPKRFRNINYTNPNGKFNLHEHRSEYENFDGFMRGAMVYAEDHIRTVMTYEASVAA